MKYNDSYETRQVKGIVVNNNQFLVLIELYNQYSDNMPMMNSYYFRIEGSNLVLLTGGDNSITSSINFIKQ
ncbi:MAG: hypothetical protein Q4E75_03130 [bacterium]|nr:hypothetical protein [bacterium]